MITMQAEGNQERFFVRKYLPCMLICILLAGVVMLVTGGVVIDALQIYDAIASLPIQAAPIVLLIAGILSSIVVIVGCLAIYCWKKNLSLNEKKIPLILFIVLLVLAAIIALVAGGLGVDYAAKSKIQFEVDLNDAIGKYGRTGLYKTLENVNSLQKQDECCGVTNYVDWRKTIYGGHRYDKVPDSCCKEESHACGLSFEISKIRHRGCFAVGLDNTTTKLMSVGYVGIVIGIFEIILCIVFCVYYFREMSSQAEQQGQYQMTDPSSDKEGDKPSKQGRQPGGTSSTQPDGASSTQPGGASSTQPGGASTAQPGGAPTATHRGKSKTAPEKDTREA